MGSELPANVQARCYTSLGRYSSNLADCESGYDQVMDYQGSDDHGTIVSETVIDIAPEVSLYISNPRSATDLRNAVAWMVSEGVLVINHSAGWEFDGPGDGTYTYPLSIWETVGRAVDGGAVWVSSAGNDARRTWFRPPFVRGPGGWVRICPFHGVRLQQRCHPDSGGQDYDCTEVGGQLGQLQQGP